MENINKDQNKKKKAKPKKRLAIITTTLSMYTTLEGKRELQNLQLQNVIPYYY